ncbi:hypothetical protein [Zhihengliuella halotolerans]|uniref:hypothetical protein n=1 Tax=Zhihengliuella halotolerans TaxID=370736 RepID=UPI000C7FB70A|nr:hypothetical protein [Zhihengliuella halotolerans]
MALHAQPSRRELPPKWDGVPVRWGRWSAHRTTLPLHSKPNDLVCHECGAVDERMINFGTRPPAPGAMFTVPRYRPGRKIGVVGRVPAWAVRDLIAFRCRHCRHDQVHDQRTGDVWDLDGSDYGPEGSTESRDTLW